MVYRRFFVSLSHSLFLSLFPPLLSLSPPLVSATTFSHLPLFFYLFPLAARAHPRTHPFSKIIQSVLITTRPPHIRCHLPRSAILLWRRYFLCTGVPFSFKGLSLSLSLWVSTCLYLCVCVCLWAFTMFMYVYTYHYIGVYVIMGV